MRRIVDEESGKGSLLESMERVTRAL